MQNLIIIGARGLGREVYSLAKQSKGFGYDFAIKGFLDDKPEALDHFENYPPIISSCEDYEVQENDVFICALGSVKWKRHYVKILVSKGARFINLVHRSVVVNPNVSLGTGIIIFDQCILSNDVAIDDFATIQHYTVIGHDASIGKFAHIGPFCFFGGWSKIEKDATVFVRSTILDKVTVQFGATVGAASLVMRDVRPNITVFGVPAKKLEY